VNTRIAQLPEEPFDFPSYTVGRFYGMKGRPYVGTRPSRKSVKSLLRRIHERTSSRWNSDEPTSTVASIKSLLRGWCAYFDQGSVLDTYKLFRKYTKRRVRHWLTSRTVHVSSTPPMARRKRCSQRRSQVYCEALVCVPTR
jgi:RNA-directed DNA polymerase